MHNWFWQFLAASGKGWHWLLIAVAVYFVNIAGYFGLAFALAAGAHYGWEWAS